MIDLLIYYCKEYLEIKLYDLIGDVTRSIAVRDPKYAFSVVRCGLLLSDNADYCTLKLKFLYLHPEKNDFGYPVDLVCVNLHNLWLQRNNHWLQFHRYRQQFLGGFSGMFVDLIYLWIHGIFFSLELKFTLQLLGKLKTLILDDCNMTRISQINVNFLPKNC